MFINEEDFDEAHDPALTRAIIHELFHFADPEHNLDHRYQEIVATVEDYARASLLQEGLEGEDLERAVAGYRDVILERTGMTEATLLSNPSLAEYSDAQKAIVEINLRLEMSQQPPLQQGGNSAWLPLDTAALAEEITRRSGVAIDPQQLRALGVDELDDVTSRLASDTLGPYPSGQYEEDAVDFTDAMMAKYFGEAEGRGDYINPLPANPQTVPELVRSEDHPTFEAEPVVIDALGDVPLSAPSVWRDANQQPAQGQSR